MTNENKGLHYQSDEDQISILIRSGYSLLYIVTWEEERALKLLRQVADNIKTSFHTWSFSQGLVKSGNHEAVKSNPTTILDQILKEPGPAMFVLLDYHPYLNDPAHIRKLRDVVAAFRRSNRTLVILSPVIKLPIELEKDITLIEFSLPSPDRLRHVLEQIIKQALELGVEVRLNEDEKESLVKAMQGLTESQAENVLAKCLVTDRELSVEDVEIIHHEKEQIIKKSGILEFYSSPDSFQNIGGLDGLKKWFRKRKDSFSDRAKEFGLPAPKGILLLGVPGCGKSLCAKALAAEWDKPLLRLDVGRIFGGLVGQSEENMRMAIQVAESVAPAIIWIDEIEKGFAGMQGSGDGGGVVARVFGTFLTWMQEKTAPVFVIATANDISKLPPELFRKGRFDEYFFVDLPFADEREEIFRIHLEIRERDAKNFNLSRLAEKTDDFSGAEIEQVVISALYDAFDSKDDESESKDDESESKGVDLTTELLITSASETQPLSKTMDAQIDALRGWAKHRCRYASEGQRRESENRAKYQLEDDGFRLNINIGNK